MRNVTGEKTRPTLTRWETVGAWLHIWTAPRDVEVPPVPRRKLALWALALGTVIAVALALIIPPLESGKRKGAAERARAQAAAVAAEAARLRADQRVHVKTIPAAADLVAALESSINTDARARDRAGTLDGPVLSTSCTPAGRYVIQFPHSSVYKCLVTTSAPHQGVLKGDQFVTGYTFVATIYSKTRRVAWCKENPRPDEKTGGHKLADVRLSPVCAGKLSQVL
jgi:type II secretory pathway pseudopilin PulG